MTYITQRPPERLTAYNITQITKDNEQIFNCNDYGLMKQKVFVARVYVHICHEGYRISKRHTIMLLYNYSGHNSPYIGWHYYRNEERRMVRMLPTETSPSHSTMLVNQT